MRGIVMPSIVQMEPELLKNLVTEEEETILTDIPANETTVPSFGIVDLWNIRRISKTAGNRFRG